MRRSPIVVLTLCLLGGACTDEPDGPPIVSIEGGALCSDPAASCALASDLVRQELDALNIVSKRTPGQPLAALQFVFEHKTRGAYQSWAEHFALWQFDAALGQQHDSSEWQRLFGALGASVSVSDGRDFATLSLLAPAPRFEAALRLLASALETPDNSEYYLEWLRDGAHASAEAVASDPAQAANQRALALLGPTRTQAAQQHSTVALVDRITPRDLDQAWLSLRRLGRVRLVLVGDVDPGQVARVLGARWRSPTRFTAGWPADEPAPTPPDRTAILPIANAPAWQVITYVVGPPRGHPDEAALQLGFTILDRRLYAHVREERGLAYAVGATFYPGRSSYGQVWLNAAQAEPALTALREALAGVLAAPPSSAEVDAARNGLETALSSESRTPFELASTLASWEGTTGDAADVDVLRQRLRMAGPEQVHAALRTYLRGAATAAAGGGGPLAPELLDGLLPP